LKFARMAIPAMALLQQHDGRRDQSINQSINNILEWP